MDTVEYRTISDHIDWIDIAKGLGILLVVIGHTLRGLVTSGIVQPTVELKMVDQWIYCFHMPLFFFLSGLFVLSSARKYASASFVWEKISTVAYPYLVWSVLTIVVKSCLGSLPNAPRSLSDVQLLFFHPIEQYWFLHTLFLLFLGFQVVFSLTEGGFIFFLGAIAVYAFGDRLLFLGEGIASVMSYAPYFALGAIVGKNRLRLLDDIPTTIISLVGVLCLVAVGVYVYLASQTLVLLVALLGIAGLCAISVAMSRLHRRSIVSYLGQRSLEIYVAHTMVSAAMRNLLLIAGIRSSEIHFISGVLAGLVGPCLFAAWLDRFGFKYVFSLAKCPAAQRASARPAETNR